MTRFIELVLLVAFVLAAASGQNVGGQDTGSATAPRPNAGASNPSPGTVAQSDRVRVISPKEGQHIAQSYVSVRFELKTPNPTSNFPNFHVQLDGQDPVRTTSPEYTFTGVAPGNHMVTVEMVDANETPIPGTRTEVHFSVLPQGGAQPSGMASGASSSQPRVVQASLIPEAENTPAHENDPLPATGSSLPLLSVIGFGVLLGGIASALKTR
jgi:hypothetical protein